MNRLYSAQHRKCHRIGTRWYNSTTFNPHTDSERHNAQRDWQTDRQTTIWCQYRWSYRVTMQSAKSLSIYPPLKLFKAMSVCRRPQQGRRYEHQWLSMPRSIGLYDRCNAAPVSLPACLLYVDSTHCKSWTWAEYPIKRAHTVYVALISAAARHHSAKLCKHAVDSTRF